MADNRIVIYHDTSPARLTATLPTNNQRVGSVK